MDMKEAHYLLDETLEKVGLHPVPGRHEVIPDEVVRSYIQSAPEVMDQLKLYPLSASIYASGVCEHISSKVSDQWENAKLAFVRAPDERTKSQLSYWLRQMCGSSKKRLEDLVEFVTQQEPAVLRDLLGFLAVKVDQEQWDRIAPEDDGSAGSADAAEPHCQESKNSGEKGSRALVPAC